jgi:hypothetical protein
MALTAGLLEEHSSGSLTVECSVYDPVRPRQRRARLI